MQQRSKERYPFGRAVRQGIMLGATVWGAGRAIEAKQPQIAEIFSNRASHSQMFTGDLGFGTRSERANNIEVTYRGKSIAAIPASSFGQPQGRFDQAPVFRTISKKEQQVNRTNHKARQSETWTARAGSAAKEKRAMDALNTRVKLAAISSNTEAFRNETKLPLNTFEELSPVAYAALLPFGKFNKRRMTLLLSLSALLASCAVPTSTVPFPTEITPAITPAAEVVGTPLVNEVLTSTPAPRIETPVVSGVSYPTEVSVMESPKVYSYGGPEGRANMDEGTRAMFDRYIAELAREGKIQGTTPEALYLDFDKKFDFKMFTTDQTLTRIIQAKSGGAFLVPENADGQVFRDLQLPYDYLFQSGAVVDAGLDNFNFHTFQADRVGGVGAWPVFVNVDAQSIPEAWLNMERGGAETPIQVASTISTNTPEAPTATEAVKKFSIDALTLSPELTAAFKKHAGLEASITLEADGRYTAAVSVLNTEAAPKTQTIEVAPASMTENLTTKNKYGDTPVMTTVDGKKLYWVQEEKGWFAVEISPDIHKPVFVPFEQREVALRVVITEFNQPFSQAAVERWKTSSGLVMGFQYLQTSAQPGGTKFAYLENPSMLESGLSAESVPVQVLDAWFTTSLPDGTTYQFYPTKWFDPANSKNLDPNEWKIIFAASGQEIMGDEGNREKFDALLAKAAAGDNHEVVPIIRIQSGFFDSTNGLITFGVAQPSLEKLFIVSGNKMDELPNPGHDGNPYKDTFDYHFSNLSSTNTIIGAGISRDDPKYHGFFPQDIQMILFPSLIIFH